jgi:hypothetical protein
MEGINFFPTKKIFHGKPNLFGRKEGPSIQPDGEIGIYFRKLNSKGTHFKGIGEIGD